jgi:DNA-binding transcriptional LysR family regulator
MIVSDEMYGLSVFAEDASFSRAAKRLHLTQPAVHAQIKRLSDTVGVPLYRKQGRNVVLTPAGAELAAFARDAQERGIELVARLRGEKAERRIVLAAGAGALLHVISDGLHAFSRTYDGRLDILTADATAAIEAVRNGNAHAGVAAVEAPPDGLDARRVADVAQMLVVLRDHRLAKKRRISIEDLDGERLVLPPPGRPQRAVLDAAFASKGIRVVAGALAVGWELVVHLVTLGVGGAIVNGSVKLPRGLVGRPVRDLPRVRYWAFTRPSARADVRALVDAMVSGSASSRSSR